MKKSIYIALMMAVCANCVNAQVLSNGLVSSSISAETPFLDVSTNFDYSFTPNNEGKGLVFPRTNLTSWFFDLSLLNGTVFPSAFNGMIVYNTGTGNTLTGLNNPIYASVVAPGFYYFFNPGASTSIAQGKWVRLGSAYTSISSGGSAVVSSYTCSTASSGILTAGVPVAGVSQTITATVTSVGTYNISTTANGVTFAGSGTFTNTGLQNVILTASGTPISLGAANFTLNSSPTCSFTRATIDASTNGTAVVSGYNCSTSSTGTLTLGTAVSGVTQTITATVITIGTYSITTAANGVTFAASGTFAGTGPQNIVLTATGTPTVVGSNTFTLNTTPNCNFSRTTTLLALPPNITLSPISPYFISSIFDQDYLPYINPLVAASLATNEASDGANEATTINYQGTLTTTGVAIRIPYRVLTAPVNLPAYSQTITIPASFTQDGISRDVTFSYNAIFLTVGSGFVAANLKAIDGTLNLKKLDIQTGVGSDNLGLLLAQFTYAINNSGSAANFDFRLISGIPDRNITDLNHLMVYIPIKAADGNFYLNNNLGADYANMAKATFNPSQQATAYNDYLAYGSLFQWGRYSDGHELINWSGATLGTPVNSTTSTLATTDTPVNALYITANTSPYDWRTPRNDNLWQGVLSANNPCPVGYRLPNYFESTALISASNINGYFDAANSALKLTTAGERLYNTGGPNGSGSVACFWTSSLNSSTLWRPWFFYLSNNSNNSTVNLRAQGYSVRCIKDY